MDRQRVGGLVPRRWIPPGQAAGLIRTLLIALVATPAATWLASNAQAAQVVLGVVTRVSDGDTVWVRPDGASQRQGERKPIKVRLHGFDAPEICQAWGLQATEALRAKLLNQRIEMQTLARDDYHRSLATMRVVSTGEDVGEWMVSRGHAWSPSYKNRPGPYAAQEREARSRARGLFADSAAVTPRRFRQTHGPCEP